MDYQVIIPAAGSGKRMKAGKNKLFLKVSGRPIISYTLDVFGMDSHCKNIFMAIQPYDKATFQIILDEEVYKEKVQFVHGGEERQHSVYHGLEQASEEVVLVHDGARPFIRPETIQELVKAAYEDGAAIAAVPVKDTIKKAANHKVVETIDRSSLWQIQTPQAFRLPILLHAHQWAKKNNYLGTDESSLVEKIGVPVGIIESDYDNIKLTTPEDLYFAEAILAKRRNTEK